MTLTSGALMWLPLVNFWCRLSRLSFFFSLCFHFSVSVCLVWTSDVGYLDLRCINAYSINVWLSAALLSHFLPRQSSKICALIVICCVFFRFRLVTSSIRKLHQLLDSYCHTKQELYFLVFFGEAILFLCNFQHSALYKLPYGFLLNLIRLFE